MGLNIGASMGGLAGEGRAAARRVRQVRYGGTCGIRGSLRGPPGKPFFNAYMSAIRVKAGASVGAGKRIGDAGRKPVPRRG